MTDVVEVEELVLSKALYGAGDSAESRAVLSIINDLVIQKKMVEFDDDGKASYFYQQYFPLSNGNVLGLSIGVGLAPIYAMHVKDGHLILNAALTLNGSANYTSASLTTSSENISLIDMQSIFIIKPLRMLPAIDDIH